MILAKHLLPSISVRKVQEFDETYTCRCLRLRTCFFSRNTNRGPGTRDPGIFISISFSFHLLIHIAHWRQLWAANNSGDDSFQWAWLPHSLLSGNCPRCWTSVTDFSFFYPNTSGIMS